MAERREHTYPVQITWTGNLGQGTIDYRSYSRDHEITVKGKPTIPGSSDPSFRGDPTRYNPEDLLVISVSSCHMLWYLHLCAVAGINLKEYVDKAMGVMVTGDGGAGHFTEVVLRPEIVIRAGDDVQKAKQLHEKAHELCFISNSVNFPVRVEPSIRHSD